MKPLSLFRGSLVLLVLYAVGCGDDSGSGPESGTGGTPGQVGGTGGSATGGATTGETGGTASGGASTGGVAASTGGLGVTAPGADVVINEFMPSNATGITDEGGGTADWIELYNRSDSAVDLGTYYISDNPENVTKAELAPGLIIEAKSTLLLWADSDEEDGDNHLPFNLAKAGEVILLSSPSGEVLDSVEYQSATTDSSFARVPHGTGDFVFCQSPTPDAPNDASCGG